LVDSPANLLYNTVIETQLESDMSTWYDEVKPFKPSKAIAWIEATRVAYNRNNPWGEQLDFAGTVEMLEESNCNEDGDYRALKALEQMREEAVKSWMNGLSAVADPVAVAKIQQTF
jgi:hypothetical protein